MKKLFYTFLLSMTTSILAAQTPARSTFYVGTGNNNDSNSLPWSIGYLYMTNAAVPHRSTFGFDFAGEGVYGDNTGGRFNGNKQSFSFNILIGRNADIGNKFNFGASAIAGIRKTDESCNQSFLGFRCFANEEPTVRWGFNYGLLTHMTYKKLTVGWRLTGESSQAIIGVNF